MLNTSLTGLLNHVFNGIDDVVNKGPGNGLVWILDATKSAAKLEMTMVEYEQAETRVRAKYDEIRKKMKGDPTGTTLILDLETFLKTLKWRATGVPQVVDPD